MLGFRQGQRLSLTPGFEPSHPTRLMATPPLGSAETVVPGDILAGKYRIERILGSGGTGVVLAATQLEQGHRVAMKLLLPAAMADAEVVGRFLREARASLSLKNPHVARIYEVGTLTGSLGTHYMVMEYLEGSDLRSLVQRGPLRVEEAVSYVLQACTALDEAHQLGIIHRDLKPENLFLTRSPDGAPLIKVLDFGISKMPLSGAEMQLTNSATVMGTPYYMAPEQMRSMKNVTVRSDIWGMGTVLYELVSARRAFNGRSITEICTQVLMLAPPPLGEAPPELGAIVMRCLEKDPAKRFASIAELAQALAPFARSLPFAPFAAAPPPPSPPLHELSRPAPAPVALAPMAPRASVPMPAPTAAPLAPSAPSAAAPSPPLPSPATPARSKVLLFVVAGLLVLVALLGLAIVLALRPT
jgi:serine/threonine protein kinase